MRFIFLLEKDSVCFYFQSTEAIAQLAITCSKLTLKALAEGVKYV